ncbi:hypothetical protein [uncultured Bifidobacterium sp.]|uniref:DUF7211 domain-containing protein n=1 Tax=uncultured Bifidobacterium sp. TaxID=165187 RepID=UPI002595B990|nr:hypothetical protein [uncultured Bifidobacterium sp.]
MYVISSDSPLLADDETYLEHYGVKGMKWGVRKAVRKVRKNERLRQKAQKYDTKADMDEHLHPKRRFGDSNGKLGDDILDYGQQRKAIKMREKANAIERKNNRTRDGETIVKANARRAKANVEASKLRYKSAKIEADLKVISKYRVKAAKARMFVAQNEEYIENMRRKSFEYKMRKNRLLGQQFLQEIDDAIANRKIRNR